MASIQKRFLKQVREAWRRDYPFLKPVNLVEVPRLPNGANFLCDRYFSERGRAYFIWFDFPQKRFGEFHLGISVTDTLTQSIRDHGLAKPTPTALGIYDVVQFGSPKRTWALVDIEAESDKFFQSLGMDTSDLALPRSQSTWFPQSYEVPEAQIFDEAITDVAATLAKYVFPALQIKP
jgi:hypothetical protein